MSGSSMASQAKLSRVILILFAAVLCVVVLLPQRVSASRFKLLGATVTGVVTIDAPVDNIIIRSVTFTGSGARLVLYAGNMGNAAASTINALLCSCVFTNYATLYVVGTSSAANYGLKLIIQNVKVSQGAGIVFAQMMPKNSVITLVTPTVDSTLRQPFNQGVISTPSVASSYNIGILFSSFGLSTGSSFVISDGTHKGTPSNSLALCFDGTLTLQSSSVLSIADTTYLYTPRGMLATGAIYINSYSVFLWDGTVFNACYGWCLQYQSSVTISGNSALVYNKIAADVTGGNVVYMNGGAWSLTSNSYWMIKGGVMTFDSGYKAISASYAVSVVSSYVVFGNNLFSYNDFSLSLSGSTTMAQCNSANGAALMSAGAYDIGGMQQGYVCSACNKLEIDCFAYLTSSYGSCSCVCSGVGQGPLCLPAVVPSVKYNCIPTDTVTMSSFFTSTLTFTEDSSRSKTRPTFELTITTTQSGTRSVLTDDITVTRSLTSSPSPSWQPSETVSRKTRTPRTDTNLPSMTFSLTQTRTLSLTPSPLTPSTTFNITYTPKTPSGTRRSSSRELTVSMSPSMLRVTGTDTVSLSRSLSSTVTSSKSVSTSLSETSFPSRSTSESSMVTDTPTHTLTESDAITCTDSVSPSLTNERSLSRSETASPSLSISTTPHITLSPGPTYTFLLTLSKSRLWTESPSPQVSSSHTQSPTVSESSTPSNSTSMTPTYSDVKSSSRSISLSYCMWYFNPPVIGTSPLTFVNSSANDTLTIGYYDYTRLGANFYIPDTGQWYLYRFNYTGTTDGVTYNPVNTWTDVSYHINVTITAPSSLYHPQLYREVEVVILYRCAVVNATVVYVVKIEPHMALASYDYEIFMMQASALGSFIVTSSVSGAFFIDTAISLGVLMLCRPPSEITDFSLIPLAIGDEASRYLRGSIIGNVFVLVGSLLVLATLSLVIVTIRNASQVLTEDDEMYLYPQKLKIIIRKRLGKPFGKASPLATDAAVTVAIAPPSDATATVVWPTLQNLGIDDDRATPVADDVAGQGDILTMETNHPSATPATPQVSAGVESGEIVTDRSELNSNDDPFADSTTAAVTAPSSTEPPPQPGAEPTAAPDMGVIVAREETPTEAVASANNAATPPEEPTQPRLFLEWNRIAHMTGFPLSVMHPAIMSILQPTVGAGAALFRMQASPPDNVLGVFAMLIAGLYFCYVTWITRNLYHHLYGEVALREIVPLWFWDDLMGAELRRRFGIFLRKSKLKRASKKKKRRRRRRAPPVAPTNAKEDGIASPEADNENDNALDQFAKEAAEKAAEEKAQLEKLEAEKEAELAKQRKIKRLEARKLTSSGGVLFVGLKYPWYAPFRLALNIVFGVAAGTPPIKENICDLQTYVVGLVTIIHIVLLIFWQPFWAGWELGLSLTSCVMVLCMCACLSVATSSRDHQQSAVDGASLCLLILICLTFLQFVLHFVAHTSRILETWKAILRLHAIPEPPPPPPLPPPPPDPPSSSSSSEYEEYEEEPEPEPEEHFIMLSETEQMRKSREAKLALKSDLERYYQGADGDEEEEDFFEMIRVDPLSATVNSAQAVESQLPVDDEDEPPDDDEDIPPEDEDDDVL